MKKGHAVLVLWGLFLGACGGGGGGGSAGMGPPSPGQFDDGLGSSGRIQGTTLVSNSNGASVSFPTVALDDSGRGLILWSDYDFNLSIANPQALVTFYAANSDAAGNWQAPEQLLSTAYSTSPASVPILRSNQLGQAVANFGPELRRYEPNTGWFAIAAPSVDPGRFLDFGVHSDPLLADGALPVLLGGTAFDISDPTRSAVKIFTQRGMENFVLRYVSDGGNASSDSAAALAVVSSQNRGDLYFVASSDAGSPTGNSIKADALNLQGSEMLLPSVNPTFLPARPTCGRARFVSSEVGSRVAAVPLLAADNVNCELFLGRFASPSDQPSFQRVTAEGFGLDVFSRDPFIAVDSRGNALAVWRDSPAGMTSTVGLMWSQSLAGGAWSTPQPLLAEAAGFGQALGVDLAMNRNGQAAAVISTVQFARSYLVTVRFSFESGWSGFSRIANQEPSSLGFVAINEQGTALAAYTNTPCARQLPLGPQGASFTACNDDSQKIFAVRF